MRPPFLSLGIFLIAFSCKKDGSSRISLQAPAIYKETLRTQLSSSRLFAVSGEIKTASTVNRFDGRDSTYLHSMINSIFPSMGRVDSIKLHDAENVEVFDNFAYSSYKLTSNGSSATLTATDTSTGQSSKEVYTRTIYYSIHQNKPVVFNEYLISSVRGFYNFGYTTKKQFHLQKEGEAFKLPWIVAVIHYADGSINYLSVQDNLNINFYKSLASGDTVVIRDYAVSYKK